MVLLLHNDGDACKKTLRTPRRCPMEAVKRSAVPRVFRSPVLTQPSGDEFADHLHREQV